MGLFSSKTKYYVSSTTIPMFDDSSRINQYAAAMLDYTANSVIEKSEYIKSYYNSSRLRNYRGYLNWCKNSGFTDLFGKVKANFYADAKLNNTEIANAIKHTISLGENDTFGVYRSKLSFFSEDFYIKYLAYQQGVADKFAEDGDLYYTISYPTDSSIRATLNDGSYVEGELPTGSSNTRFIEISYSIIREVKEENQPPKEENSPEKEGTSEDSSTNSEYSKEEGKNELLPTDPEDNVNTPTYITEYGFYHYKEGSGNSELDKIIKTTGASVDKTFFPPIPIRTNTSWFSKDKAEKINEALVYLNLYDYKSDKESAYKNLQKQLTDGMTEGSISDIDYITMLPGVVLNSDNQADQKYIFEFFYNLYLNYALQEARPDPGLPKTLYSGSNYIHEFEKLAIARLEKSSYSDSYFTSFTLTCPSSNLNLTYSWGNSDYFESNGKWHPKAKVGEYGVLSTHKTIRLGFSNIPYSLSLFCHQTSLNRFRFIVFTSLSLINLIYHGKTIETFAHDAIMAASIKEDVTLSFDRDTGPDSEYASVSFKRVIATGEIDTPFIVPLEDSTFKEVGVKNQLDISYGSQFLIFNCWVKQKKKWYQRGFLGKVLAFVGLAIGIVLCFTPFAPLGWAMIIYFGTICVSIMLEMAFKILCAIFGDKLGARIYSFALQAFKSVLVYVANVCKFIPVIGWAIYGICMAAYFLTSSGEYLRQGLSMSDALKQAAGETLVSAAAGAIAQGVGNAISGTSNAVASATANAGTAGVSAGSSISTALTTANNTLSTMGAIAQGFTQGAISGFGNSLVSGGSFKDAFKAGLTQGAISGVAAGVMAAFKGIDALDYSKGLGSGGIDPIDVIIAAETKGIGAVITNAATDAVMDVIKNPNTYANLIGMVQEERYYHKMANLENDYKEFNNNMQAAQDALDMLNASMLSTATAEFVVKLQTSINRTCADSESLVEPEVFFNTSLASGSDMVKSVLGSPSCFVDNKLSLEGYTPSVLYFTQNDYTTTWDI